ncbi:hypothetical protein JCM33374_g732 [Metschnikowia sp. JCM 33374]|nr:hypothetical protein JCM33374_g732 [Metschnikowia sp. JCM 33374]
MSTNSPEDVGSDFKSNTDNSSEGKSARSRRPKACKQCHALKVRCIPVDENDPASPCVRCINAKRTCEIDFLEPKKKKKKIAPRPEKDVIADLKNQISMLQSEVNHLRSRPASEQADSQGPVLSNNHTPLNTSESYSPPFMTKTDLEKELGLLSGNNLSLKEISDEIKEYAHLRDQTLRNDTPTDAISLGIIDITSAKIRLKHYRSILYPSHSYVKINDEVTVESMMKTEPFLLNAVMAVTSTVRRNDSDFSQSLALEKHAMDSVMREILVAGSKSVELIKCLILLSVWYNTPEFFKARRYHILNQMAVTLLYDLGIITRQSFTYSGESKTMKNSEDSTSDLEYRLLILTLYCSTVGFCLILRRAIYVKWTAYVEECCSILETREEPCYKNIALFSRLTRELEKVHHVVHSPECFSTNPRISTYTMSEFNTRLAVIGNNLSKDNHILLAYYYSIEAYLYQPSSEDLQVKSVGQNCTEELTTRTLHTISQCTSSCLKAMDEFNQLTDEQIAGLPLFHFTRIVYTAGILMRLRYFILSLPSNIEKDLVPRYAIVSVSNLHQRINMISDVYPTNFLMKKMKLVLSLFVQTYVTQVNELISRNNDGSLNMISTQVSKNDYKNMNKLAFSLMNSSFGSKMGPKSPPGLHLDLLSYAATEHQKSNGVQSEPQEETNRKEQSTSETVTVPVEISRNLDSAPATFPTNQPTATSFSLENRYNASERIFDPVASSPSGQCNNGGPYTMAQAQVNHQLFGLSNNMESSTAHIETDSDDLKGEKKDIYEFDDEFWSNLLTTDADKYFFAQDVPNGTGNVLYNIFN